MDKRYNDFNTYLRSVFGCRVQKITVDAGLTCPNRDGTLSTGGCIFCNSRGSGTGAHTQGLTITDQVTQGKKYLGRPGLSGKKRAIQIVQVCDHSLEEKS